MCKGLPASGKTTWSREQVLASNGRTKRVNKDDLRAMIDAGKWSKGNEKNILSCRDELITNMLFDKFDVIVDDTNFDSKHEAQLRGLAEVHGAEFEIKDFTDVSLSTCLKRDSERANPVGEKVIRTMYNSFVKQKGHVAKYELRPRKDGFPNCIIVDIDGTLAHITDRSPYDYSKVSTDTVDPVVRDIIRKYTTTNIMEEVPQAYIIVLSGRESSCRVDTEQWLKDNQVPFDELYMRQTGDMREDSIVKKELFDTYIDPRYNVLFVLDDRDRVVKMWREQGLKVLQVAEGDF
jgi:predicted kinase